MTITKGQLKARLEELGMAYGQFDIYCGLERDTTQNLLKKGSEGYVSEFMEEKINALGDEQEKMGLLAIDKVIQGKKEGSDNLVFVPHFLSVKSYSRSGYMHTYGTFLRFKSDSEYLYKRLTTIEKNILCFTPASVDYKDADVFAGFDENANRIVIDPLRIRKELGLHLGGYKLSEDKMKQRIAEEVETIQDAVTVEIVEYTRLNGGVPPKVVYIPRYLNVKDFMKRRLDKRMDVGVYNKAATQVIEELDAKAKIFDEGYRVMGCDPKDLCEPKVDVLTIDVLGLVYGGK